MRQSHRVLAFSLAAAGLLATAACGGSGKAKPSASPTTSVSVPSSTPVKSTPPPAPVRNPYTGVGGVPATPTVAVKIDDTDHGRPQVNIDQADIVYVEAAEAGLTRLAAIYGTHKPTAVGYVRSTRPSDPELLLQYGKITEAFSGGASDSLSKVQEAGLVGWSQDAGAAYYVRQPHDNDNGYVNVVLDVAQVAATTKSARPKSIGWTFNPSLAGLPTKPGTDVRTMVSGSYGPNAGTPVEFRWSSRIQRYVRYIDGAEQFEASGAPVATTNVVVQFCQVVSHPEDVDVNGQPSQFTFTVGHGQAAVFRQGRRIDGTWSRSGSSSGTVFKTAGGAALPLNPGNTWVVLVSLGAPLSS